MKIMNKDIYLNCSYIPPEIFVAADINPIRLWPSKIGQRGQNLIPVDICPYTRAILSQLYFDKKTVLANSCDGMRRLYDIIPDGSFLLEVPRKSELREVNYYYQQLMNLLDFLHIDYDNRYRGKLKIVIDNYNRKRRLLAEIQKKKSALLLLQGVEIYCGSIQRNLQKLLKKNDKCKASEKGPSILLTASCLLDGQIIELIVENNLQIAAIDSCLGERSFNFQIDVPDNRDPLKALAEGYLKKTACPRSMEAERRLQEINRLMKSRMAEGIIYFMPKFCDQAAYDYKLIKDWTLKNNIPVLKLEGEYRSSRSGQLNTRIAAFRESLVMTGWKK